MNKRWVDELLDEQSSPEGDIGMLFKHVLRPLEGIITL